jgi:hypothetical protein
VTELLVTLLRLLDTVVTEPPKEVVVLDCC